MRQLLCVRVEMWRTAVRDLLSARTAALRMCETLTGVWALILRQAQFRVAWCSEGLLDGRTFCTDDLPTVCSAALCSRSTPADRVPFPTLLTVDQTELLNIRRQWSWVPNGGVTEREDGAVRTHAHVAIGIEQVSWFISRLPRTSSVRPNKSGHSNTPSHIFCSPLCFSINFSQEIMRCQNLETNLAEGIKQWLE